MHLAAREGLSRLGSVGVIHSGQDIEAWWIWKDDEVEPTFAVTDHEDLLFVVRGSLRPARPCLPTAESRG